MSIVFWGLSPHPPLLIPEVGGASVEKVRNTTQAMSKLAERIVALEPERIIIMSPHAPHTNHAVPVFDVPSMSGDMKQFRCPNVKLNIIIDREYVKDLAQTCKDKEFPILCLDSEVTKHYSVPCDIDHGCFLPLYFLEKAGLDFEKTSFVIMGTMGMAQKDHYAFGSLVAQSALVHPKKTVFIASGDLSHRLLESGPYGFDEMGPLFDKQTIDALSNADCKPLLEMSSLFTERAGQCGLCSILTMLGSMPKNVKPDILSYEGPFGVGYGVATFTESAELDVENSEDYRIKVARRAVEEYVRNHKKICLDENIPIEMQQPKAAFVTLKINGDLRGCIGTLEPTCSNQLEEISQNAVSACSKDPRFPPVSLEELPNLEYQVYTLNQPTPVKDIKDLDPKKYGVVVSKGHRRGVLLPDLEGIDTVEKQLTIACHKGGINITEKPDLYRFEVSVYGK